MLTRPLLLTLLLATALARADGPTRIPLDPKMVTNEAKWGHPEWVCDEQDAIGDPPAQPAAKAWDTDYRFAKDFPISAFIDLGKPRHLATLFIYDINGSGELEISIGEPGKWEKATTYPTDAYKRWVPVPLDATTRYLRLTRKTPGAQFAEIALYEYSDAQWTALQEKKAADKKAAEERAAALAKAAEDVKNRPVVDLGEPFGKVTLVDEIDCAAEKPTHLFAEHPAGASRIETILGQPARVLPTQAGEASYLSWRIGRLKLIKPGAAYVLSVEYPEDAPRSIVVLNGGCETSRGFHTGATTGDALRAKYVWSNPESLQAPVSGKWEAWTQFFHLHSRFPERAFIRGKGLRALTPDDGFPVTLAQFTREDDPPSRGVAVKKIRLYEIANPRALDVKLPALPEGLPTRRIFWREEMADGVIESTKPEERGLANPLDWYRHKASMMHFLGINTYTKDLLEFGACQHWDPTAGGGNNWVFFSEPHKSLWGQIVELMGKEGFGVLPYYEYSGSKGYKGLGNQRRCKPLTRDDAYTHIKWIESSNADLTDPDTLADFAKMLDLTVVKFKDTAKFAGVWIRPRMQLPMSFGDGALGRFAKEANNGQAVTREDLKKDKALLARYEQWWFGKRRAFLEAVRDHLRKSGVSPEAIVLYTTDASEPGASFPTWDKRLVTDDPVAWTKWLQPGNAGKDKPIQPIPFEDVLAQNLYFAALTSAPLNWGGWDWQHASPPADPQRYADAPGLMLTHGFNRLYTTSNPATLDAFRTPAGLTLVRHYSLNENMMFDKGGKDLLGYFVADMERTGAHCMMAEALAVAHGDPTHLACLTGNSYARGFPQPVRRFHTAFLALPALPSQRVESASADKQVAVRLIRTPTHGAWLSVVNTAWATKTKVKVTIPVAGTVTDAATGQPLARDGNTLTLDLTAGELRALRVK